MELMAEFDGKQVIDTIIGKFTSKLVRKALELKVLPTQSTVISYSRHRLERS